MLSLNKIIPLMQKKSDGKFGIFLPDNQIKAQELIFFNILRGH